MIVTESNEGPYRVYAAAIRGEDPGAGFTAAVVIARRELLPLGEALRDLDIGAGQRWASFNRIGDSTLARPIQDF
jgi:hypothetical protein